MAVKGSTSEEPVAGRSSRQGCNPAGESPAVTIAYVGHVVMPQLDIGNESSTAWCKRPGCPDVCRYSEVGATCGSSKHESLKISE